MRVLLVIALSSMVASFSDWLCMDILVHRFYRSAPEIWRPRGGAGRIWVSQIIGTLASAAIIVLCLALPQHKLLVACAAWAAGPLPVILQNLQWMKLHPAIAGSHAAGWLARLLIAAELAAWLLPG